MSKLYLACSIIYRTLLGFAAIGLLCINYILTDLADTNDDSLMLPFFICAACVIAVTIFHNLPEDSIGKLIFQVLSILIVIASAIYSVNTSITIINNDGSLIFLTLLTILFITCLPLIYFIFRDKKYNYFS